VPLKPYITAEPEVLCHDLRADEDAVFVVLASDGLWDVMSNEEVAHFVTRSEER
jgi:serine/threonine protein phosphatase PrpC